MCLKRVLYIALLVFSFLVPGTGADAAYQMTEQEMIQLEDIFRQLDSRQKQQQMLLNQQAEQLETLNTQLKTSQTEIESSRKAVETLQTSLNMANKSLQASAAAAKSEHDRLERQRDTWALVAVLVLGVSIANN